MNYLVGDIGGTNTRFLFSNENGINDDNCILKSYPSQEFSNFNKLLSEFLSEFNLHHNIDAACFAIAGPVEKGAVSVTNLPWVIQEEQLKHNLCTAKVKLINDFYAVANGISELKETDVIIVQQGLNMNNSDAAIIGAGTGLGVAHRVLIDSHFHTYTSEAGHTGFAPENTLQSELLIWMQQKHNHVSLEMLLSGKGLATLYDFFHSVKGIKESVDVRSAMKGHDAAQIITEFALKNTDELCQKALSCFIDIYGAAAGNVALHYYPVGEIYIAGGIAAKMKDKIVSPAFIQAFVNKGLLSENIKNITIKLITQEKVGLLGALAVLKNE